LVSPYVNIVTTKMVMGGWLITLGAEDMGLGIYLRVRGFMEITYFLVMR